MNCYFAGVNGKAMFGVRQVGVLDDVINDDDDGVDDDDDDDQMMMILTDRQKDRKTDTLFQHDVSSSTRRWFS